MTGGRYTNAICLGIVLLMIVLTLLFCFGESLGMEAVERENVLSVSATGQAVISLQDGASSVNGSGAYVNENIIHIAYGGEYTICGELGSGQIIVETEKGAPVTICLSGASVFCGDGAALWVKNAGSVTIELAAGSENYLGSGTSLSDESRSAEVSAALYSEDTLHFQGTGSLTVEGGFEHGIVCKDDLSFAGGSYSVTAVSDGIRGRDSVYISGGSYAIEAGGDGIQSNNDLDPLLGTVDIDGGSFVIAAGQDGVQAETALSIRGGEFELLCGGGAADEPITEFGLIHWSGADSANTESAKGLKAGTDLLIERGSFTLDCGDDALHCGAALVIRGGELTLASGDDAVHADVSLSVSGGTITVTNCQEGLEAPQIEISGGELNISAGNDGINANGDGRGEELPGLSISGGRVSIHCYADGLDSNGDLIISGGEVYVSAQASDGNCALDYGRENGGVGLINGGSIVACGYSGMAETFEADSRQPSLLYVLEDTFAGGTGIILESEDGRELLQYTPANDFNAVIVSCAELKVGEKYILNVGGQRWLYTQDSVVTTVGSVRRGGPGGFGAMGGGMPMGTGGGPKRP